MNREFVGIPEELAHGWNEDLEELIADIEEKSWAYTWLHNTSVNYFTKWNDRLSVTGLAIDIGTGTSTFATLNNCNNLFWVQVSTGVVIYIGAFIGGYLHYHRMSERIERHKFAASRYSSLYHNIQRERGLRPDQRQNAKDYIMWVTNQYDSLLLSSPEIEDNILKRYFTEYSNKHRSHPVIYNNVKQMNNAPPINPLEGYLPFSRQEEDSLNRSKIRRKYVTGSCHSDNSIPLPEVGKNKRKHRRKHRKEQNKKEDNKKEDDKLKSNIKLEIDSESEDELETAVRNSEIGNIKLQIKDEKMSNYGATGTINEADTVVNAVKKEEPERFNESRRKLNESNNSGRKLNESNNSGRKLNESNDSGRKLNESNDSRRKLNESNDSGRKLNESNNSGRKSSQSRHRSIEKNTRTRKNSQKNQRNGSINMSFSDLFETLQRTENLKIPVKLPKKVAETLGQDTILCTIDDRDKRFDLKNVTESPRRNPYSRTYLKTSVNSRPSSPRDYNFNRELPINNTLNRMTPERQTAPARMMESTPIQVVSSPRNIYGNLGNNNYKQSLIDKFELTSPRKKKEYFNHLKNQLNDRTGNILRNYYGDYDNNLMEWQLNRSKNQATREEIDFNRMARQDFIDPIENRESF